MFDHVQFALIHGPDIPGSYAILLFTARQNDRILKGELPGSVDVQYATGDQWRNNSGKNEEMEPKQKQYPVVDVTGDRSKV